jgi:hypothetical protein
MKKLLLIACLVGCGPYAPPPEDGTKDDCAEACANMISLGCEGANGSPGADQTYGTEDDLSCERVCLVYMEPPSTMHPACVAQASSCEEVDQCFE